MECPGCRSANGPTSRHCHACGASLALACPACGTLGALARRFCGECGAALADCGSTGVLAAVAVPAIPAGVERRQLTAMFCDLVGSTALAARLDLEDMGATMAAYQGCAATLIGREGGAVAQYLGDGVLAYFGYPRAREEDAECAVRAGLALAGAVARLATPAGPPGSLQARIGIATGLVVIGVPHGVAGAAPSAVGDTPNVAARLQALAAPGGVVVDAATRRQVGRLFDLEEVRPGSTAAAWRVRAESAAGSRFEALRAEQLMPLVGREDELDWMLQRWRQASAGAGQAVLISGEAGIGKSRLLAALEERMGGEPCQRLRYFCAPHRQDSAFHPVIAHLERAVGIGREDAPETRLDKLALALARTGTPPESVALFADLMSLPATGRLPALPVSAQRRKEATVEALRCQIETLARRVPVMMLVEDLHWADPSSLELLDRTVEHVADAPVLLVATFRPEFEPPWLGRAGVSLLALGRLDRQQARQVAASVAAGTALGRVALGGALLERIVSEADGVPLFIEELTKAVVEDQGRSTAPGARLAVPSTLQASLMARLDRLPAAKEVAQVGAVLGRTFLCSLAATLAGVPEAALRRGLDELVTAGLASRDGAPPEEACTFKHALVQDAAYESLLRSRRAALHARAVDALLAHDPGLEESQPELLGHHCAEAGLTQRATSYLLRAAQRSAARSDMEEARGHLARGVALTEAMPDGAARRLRRAEMLLALGNVELATRGFGTPEHGAAFAEAAALCRSLPADDPRSALFAARVMFGDWSVRLHRGEMELALATAEELLQLGRGEAASGADHETDSGVRVIAATVHGLTCFLAGKLSTAAASFTRVLAGSSLDERADATAAEFGVDALSLARAQFSRTLACAGLLDQAAAQARLGVDRARRLGHLPTLAVALTAACTTSWILGDVATLRTSCADLVALATERNYALWLTRGQGYAGWVAAQDGDVPGGRRRLEASIADLRRAGIVLYGPADCAMLADICTLGGDLAGALSAVEAGLALAVETGEAWCRADLLRRRGELLASTGDAAGAERALRDALAVAEDQAARLAGLRAAARLARLLRDRGERVAAYGLLAPRLAGFTEGCGAPDLRDAASLLDALR
jgi:class 3 adenylate cyclase/tetratricopeptide (TPR) repeat protein